MTTTRVAVPSRGRLRESVLDLLDHAGYSRRGFDSMNASAVIEGIEFIEMRPRDAAAWLAEGRLDAAFISTDTALENHLEDWPSLDLRFSHSDLVVACREDSPYSSIRDLDGASVATHLPGWTERWLRSEGVDAHVVFMGGMRFHVPELVVHALIVAQGIDWLITRATGTRTAD